jgi:hypothetical protein
VQLGSADVDGDPREWTSADRFADLAEDGSARRPDLGTLSLRYECSSRVLYLLVGAEHDAPLKTAPARATIVRVDGQVVVSGKDGDDDRAPDGHWVYRRGSKAAGWEASARIEPGDHRLLVHILVRVGHRTVHVLTVPRTVSIRIDCPVAPEPTPTAAPSPSPEPTAKPTKSPKPAATPRPTRSSRPTETAKPTRSPRPSKTPKATASPSPTCPADDANGARHGGRKSCDDDDGGKGKGRDKDHGSTDGGFVIVLPLAFGATAWATRPRRTPRRLHRRQPGQ